MSFGNLAKLKWGVKLNEDTYVLIGDEDPVVAGERVVYIGQYEVGTSRLFRDGLLVAMENAPVLSLVNNSVTIRIGYHEFWEKYFNGAILDCMIFNRALSGDDISTLLNSD